jgi:hypothetical protein
MRLKFLIRSAPCVVAGLCIFLIPISHAAADEVTAELNESEAQRLSIFHDYNISSIGSTDGDIPNTTDGGMLTSYLGRWVTDAPTANDRAWSVSATPVIGYDSDPEGLKNERGSLFGGADLAANYGLKLTGDNGDPTAIAFNYDATGAVYKGTTKQGDNLQQTVAAGIEHKMFGDTIVLNGLFNDQFTVDHGSAFLNTINASAAAEIFWLSQLSTELSYRFSHLDFFYSPQTKELDPDANRDVVDLSLHLFPLPQTRDATVAESPDRLTDFLRSSLRRLTLGYAYVWNRSDGSDYRYEANRIHFGFDDLRPFHTNNISFDLQYAHEWQVYNNKSTETVPVLNGNHFLLRHDHLDVFTVRANLRLADLAHDRGTIGQFLQWDIIADRSNIQTHDFNEFIISTGLEYRY